MNISWNKYSRSAASLLIGLSVFAVCGCNSNQPATYSTTGKVVFADGSPLAGGTIMFQTVGGKGDAVFNARGLIGEDGTFAMTTFEPNDGAVAGEHQVLVRESMVIGDFQSPAATARLVAPRFMSFDTSGLTVKVKEEDNDLTIQVDRPASRRK